MPLVKEASMLVTDALAGSLVHANMMVSPFLLHAWKGANAPDGAGPCQRSLHVAAVWRDRMLCFGGYDGSHRARSRRPVVWRRLHAIDAPRLQE